MSAFKRLAELVEAANAGLRESVGLLDQERQALDEVGRSADKIVVPQFTGPGGVAATMSARSSGGGGGAGGPVRTTRDRGAPNYANTFFGFGAAPRRDQQGNRQLIQALDRLPSRIAKALGGDGGAAVRARGGF